MRQLFASSVLQRKEEKIILLNHYKGSQRNENHYLNLILMSRLLDITRNHHGRTECDLNHRNITPLSISCFYGRTTSQSRLCSRALYGSELLWFRRTADITNPRDNRTLMITQACGGCCFT